jgi:hypothetical protein
MTLSSLAGFHYSARDVKRNSNHFSKLREAYMGKWQNGLYSIFWSNNESGKLWLCNVFVGDAIYLHNNKSITQGNNHYFDPEQIKIGRSPLLKRNSYKDVEIGDIVVFGTTHVEIITDVQNNWIADDGFCSIGAGRGGTKEDMGDIRCDSDNWYVGGSRELNDPNNTYYHIL